MYVLRLLGGVALEGSAGPLSGDAAQRRQLAILAMLATAGDSGLSRDRLLACIWPNASSESARHSLNDAVYRLRKALGQKSISGRQNTLRLNPQIVGILGSSHPFTNPPSTSSSSFLLLITV